MKWRISGVSSVEIGGKKVPVKTLFLKNKWGQRVRCRVKTVQNPIDKKDFSLPAYAQLARDKKGKIGALVTGAYYGSWIKIGKFKRICPYLFVSLDALAKNVRRKLLAPLDYELIEEEDTILAKEKEDSSYYVGSVKSNIFHQPGCWQAKRIKEAHRFIFPTKQEALKRGYTIHRICGE